MVNEREKKTAEKYEEEGWTPIRCGAPDWLMMRTNDGEVKKVKFVEVKSPNSKLRYEQEMWRRALEKLGADFKMEIVE